MANDDNSTGAGGCCGVIMGILGLVLFIYTMVVYNQQVVPNFGLENKYDSNYDNQLNWLRLFAFAEIGSVSASVGLLFLTTLIACCVACFSDPDEKMGGVMVLFLVVLLLGFLAAFIIQAYFVWLAVPISSTVANECNTNITYSRESACILFYSSFNPIVTLLEVVFGFNCFNLAIMVIASVVFCVVSACK